jgi:hypothetical protein
MGKLIIISLVVLLLNVPFGYWRRNVRRLSLQWFLAIHIPVPVIIALRLTTGIGFAWYTYLFLVAAFFSGQQAGSMLLKPVHKKCHQDSSCIFMDLIRCSLV